MKKIFILSAILLFMSSFLYSTCPPGTGITITYIYNNCTVSVTYCGYNYGNHYESVIDKISVSPIGCIALNDPQLLSDAINKVSKDIFNKYFTSTIPCDDIIPSNAFIYVKLYDCYQIENNPVIGQTTLIACENSNFCMYCYKVCTDYSGANPIKKIFYKYSFRVPTNDPCPMTFYEYINNVNFSEYWISPCLTINYDCLF
jgi:hypothetical protein